MTEHKREILVDQLFSGDLIGVTIVTWYVPRRGWCLRLTETFEYMGVSGPRQTLYDSMSRGELLEVLLAVRENLSIGTEY